MDYNYQEIHSDDWKKITKALTLSMHAQHLIETFEASQAEGKGAYALDGVMIDLPLVKAARNVLEPARAAGKL